MRIFFPKSLHPNENICLTFSLCRSWWGTSAWRFCNKWINQHKNSQQKLQKSAKNLYSENVFFPFYWQYHYLEMCHDELTLKKKKNIFVINYDMWRRQHNYEFFHNSFTRFYLKIGNLFTISIGVWLRKYQKVHNLGMC